MEEVRGVEENYFSMMQKTMIPLPWIADLNAQLQSYRCSLQVLWICSPSDCIRF